MSERITTVQLDRVAAVTAAPVRTKVDRTFGLPSGLYYATVGLYLVFLGIMSAMLLNGELLLPMAVIVGSVIVGFGLNRTWAGMKPDNPSRPLSWGQFANRGIQTLSGPLTAFEASVQVLMLPVLIVFWGLAVAVIIATVR
mgnify:CR=1 FL=1